MFVEDVRRDCVYKAVSYRVFLKSLDGNGSERLYPVIPLSHQPIILVPIHPLSGLYDQYGFYHLNLNQTK